MRDADWFYKSILDVRKNRHLGYGENVTSAIKIYSEIDSPEERREYQRALEMMLQSSNPQDREYAVNLCLGFFVFRDSV